MKKPPVIPASVKAKFGEYQNNISGLTRERNSYVEGVVDALGVDKTKYGFDLSTMSICEIKAEEKHDGPG